MVGGKHEHWVRHSMTGLDAGFRWMTGFGKPNGHSPGVGALCSLLVALLVALVPCGSCVRCLLAVLLLLLAG